MTQLFFLLQQPYSNNVFLGMTTADGDYDVMMRALHGEAVPGSPIRIAHHIGRVLQDLVWVSMNILVHQRILDILTDAQLTGWSTYPVELTGRQGESIPGYHGLIVTGRCAGLLNDRAHSELVYQELPGGRFPRYRGLHVEGWDGSDFFVTPGQGHMVLSEKAAAVLRQSDATNVELQPASEFEHWADDQPEYLKPRILEALHAGPDVSVTPLGNEELSEIAELALQGRVRLGVPEEEPAERAAAQIMRYVEQTRPLEEDDLIEPAMELACLWGELVVREAAGWEWAALEDGPDGGDVRYAVVGPNLAHAVEPVAYFYALLGSDVRENNVLLLYNMIVTGRLPDSAEDSLLMLG